VNDQVNYFINSPTGGRSTFMLSVQPGIMSLVCHLVSVSPPATLVTTSYASATVMLKAPPLRASKASRHRL
jgi:hypothetical protein